MYCPYCGSGIPDDTAFCTNCGRKLNAAEAIPFEHAAQTGGETAENFSGGYPAWGTDGTQPAENFSGGYPAWDTDGTQSAENFSGGYSAWGTDGTQSVENFSGGYPAWDTGAPLPEQSYAPGGYNQDYGDTQWAAPAEEYEPGQDYGDQSYAYQAVMNDAARRSDRHKIIYILLSVFLIVIVAAILVLLLTKLHDGGDGDDSKQESSASEVAEETAEPDETASPTPTADQAAVMTAEEATELVEKTYSCYAQLGSTDNAQYMFSCYSGYDSASGTYSGLLGTVSVDAATGEITVINGMDTSQSTAADPASTDTPGTTAAPAASPSPSPSQSDRVIGTGAAPANYLGIYYVTAADFLSLRNGASADTGELGRMNYADTVYVLEQTGTFWYAYSPSLGMYGYCASEYLSQTAPAGSNGEDETYVVHEGTLPAIGDGSAPTENYAVRYASVSTGYLALRNAQEYNDNNIIGEINDGEAVWVIDTTEGQYWFVYVPSLGKYGYANSDHIVP